MNYRSVKSLFVSVGCCTVLRSLWKCVGWRLKDENRIKLWWDFLQYGACQSAVGWFSALSAFRPYLNLMASVGSTRDDHHDHHLIRRRLLGCSQLLNIDSNCVGQTADQMFSGHLCWLAPEVPFNVCSAKPQRASSSTSSSKFTLVV